MTIVGQCTTLFMSRYKLDTFYVHTASFLFCSSLACIFSKQNGELFAENICFLLFLLLFIFFLFGLVAKCLNLWCILWATGTSNDWCQKEMKYDKDVLKMNFQRDICAILWNVLHAFICYVIVAFVPFMDDGMGGLFMDSSVQMNSDISEMAKYQFYALCC